MKNNTTKVCLFVGIIFLLFFSVLDPFVIGNNMKNREILNNNYFLDEFDKYTPSEDINSRKYKSESLLTSGTSTNLFLAKTISEIPTLDNSFNVYSWPIYCHDNQHTSRSPYSTADNLGDEKWRKKLSGQVRSPVIDNEGVIYVGADNFYAIYPNGTIKWIYDTPCHIESAPAIDKNSVLYVGTVWAETNYFYAISPNGSLKWKYRTGEDIYSSPVIGDDGIIYFGDSNNYINALYPNGTLKWRYKTGHVVYSSPAIGKDGIIYCGSHDEYLYALYPNNGTLKWKYKTGGWIRTSPSIADDDTIYVVSLDNYLHAVYPNGTLKWKTNMGNAGTSPTIGRDGTIYAGYKKLFAIYPTNGSVKWTFNPGSERTIRGGTPANSLDGTIYFGTSDGGEIIAVNSDGTEKWRKIIGRCESAPAIGEDGTIYVGSSQMDDGYLYAFGELDTNAPDAPHINGPHSGKAETEYEYMFKSTSPLGNDIFYYIEWGDGSKKDWLGPFSSGEEVKVSHTWSNQGTYTIRARAKDTDNLWGPWGEFEVSMSRDKAVVNSQLSELMSNIYFSRSLNQFIMAGFQL